MTKKARPNKNWFALDNARDICGNVSIIDDLTEEELHKLHKRITWQKAAGLNLVGYLEEVSKKFSTDIINETKLERLALLVGEDAVPDYLACCVLKVMWNMRIINIRVENH